MSQQGLIDIEGSHPQIPTEFITDSGTAIPIGNQLEVLGNTVGNGTYPKPLETTGAGNTVEVNIQVSTALSSPPIDKNDAGIASFDSSAFAVDANGYVTLISGGIAVESINVDASTAPGTDPVLPNGSGEITVTGAQIAASSTANVIRTNSLAPNTYSIEVQRSSASAASAIALNGVSHFNSAEFTVDGNGFVSLAGGGLAIDSVAVQTGTSPIVPTAAGLITINGAVVAAGTNPVRSDGTGANTLALEVQISQAVAATDATKIGLANFDSAAFDVDANGFVQLNGGGIATTSFDVQANTAPGTDPVVPSSAGVVTVNGAVVANHSVVLESRSRAANAYNLEVQYATTAASTDGTKSGVAHFNSAQFSVDANGFVSSIGGGMSWVFVTGTTQTFAANTGYVTGNGGQITFTLPATAVLGDQFIIAGNSAGGWKIAQNGGQQIYVGSSSTTVGAGGSVTSTNAHDSITIVCAVANTTFIAYNFVGNLTIA